jgi:uncharacterized protein YoxC
VLHVAALIASLAFLALVVAAIPMFVQLARTARTAEQTLTTLEREVRPLASQVQALLEEHRGLAGQATRDLRHIEGATLMVQDMLARLTGLTGLLGSFTTVGRALGVARGLQRGIDVFVRRLARAKE